MAGQSRLGRESAFRTLVSLPYRPTAPLAELTRRGLMAFGLLLASTLLVWFDRAAYIDNTNGDGVGLVDALYYSTVTMTTTGYGDITPVAPHARLLNAVLITPMRVGFLVLLVGTTIEVLANQGRRILLDNRWRKRMRNHVVVVGYGTKGRSAISTLVMNDTDLSKVVVIDNRSSAVAEANRAGLAAIHGEANDRQTLRAAEISKARQVVITLDRDDTAILSTLTVRQLNPSAHIAVAVREHVNVALVRQSGANAVVTSSDAVGRMLGLATVSPTVGAVIDDMLSSGAGLEVHQRQVAPEEVGLEPSEVRGERVLAVVRHDSVRRFYDPTVGALRTGDEVVVIRRAVAPVGKQRRASDPLRVEGSAYTEGPASDDD
ncbi:potassium channel family protein [Parenemella sanctibonifatiensis]|uniref:Potassium transporter Kef n=1 Tax=Parenemella sanctibonifatiensis TaxID=2016505 RepID=A0A255E6G1_9ACTN|nr:potassium channel family protein [Parenemella sanctibonifatiensis]OYN86541.1 potassium transporter Kef [Parenemella sanctibonifatiensis]